MDIRKKLFLFLLLLLIIYSLVNKSNINASANMKKDVSNTIKDMDKIENLFEEFRDLVGFHAVESNENVTFDFSKLKNRREALKYTYDKHGKLSKKEQQKLSKQLFGKSVSKKTEQAIGDWGEAWPVLEIDRIYKLSAKNFRAKIIVYFEDDDGNKDKKAVAIFNLAKTSKSEYGYYVKKVKILL